MHRLTLVDLQEVGNGARIESTLLNYSLSRLVSNFVCGSVANFLFNIIIREITYAIEVLRLQACNSACFKLINVVFIGFTV